MGRVKVIMETWVKPNGKEVQINSDNHRAAREIGWVPKEEYQSTVEPDVVVDMPKRRGRPPKE
jgi:hypothetical protein